MEQSCRGLNKKLILINKIEELHRIHIWKSLSTTVNFKKYIDNGNKYGWR